MGLGFIAGWGCRGLGVIGVLGGLGFIGVLGISGLAHVGLHELQASLLELLRLKGGGGEKGLGFRG